MAQPITWRNVTSGSNAAANQLLQNSQTQLQSNLKGLGATAQGLADQQRSSNTEQEISNIRALDNANQVAGYTPGSDFVDNVAVRQALEAQPGRINDQATTDFNLADTQRQRADTDTLAGLNAQLANASSPQEITGIREGIAGSGLSNQGQASIAGAINAREEQVFKSNDQSRQRTDQLNARNAETQITELLASGIDPSVAQGEISAITSNLPLDQQLQAQQKYQEVTETIGKNFSPVQRGTLSSQQRASEQEIATAETQYQNDYATAQRAYPVDQELSQKAEVDAGLSVGSVVSELQAAIPGEPLWETEGDTGGGALPSRVQALATEYENDNNGAALPGWILKEAVRLAGSTGEEGAWLSFDKSIDFTRVKRNVKDLSKKFKKQQNNFTKLQDKQLQLNEAKLRSQDTAAGKFSTLQNSFIKDNTSKFYKSRRN